MTDETQDSGNDFQFYQLVVSLHAATMQQLGKTLHPVTGKLERDLTMAQQSIDMLDMLKRKTEGNLNEEEKSLLDRVLYEVRMNFVDESKKGDEPESDGDENSESESEESNDAATSSDDTKD